MRGMFDMTSLMLRAREVRCKYIYVYKLQLIIQIWCMHVPTPCFAQPGTLSLRTLLEVDQPTFVSLVGGDSEDFEDYCRCAGRVERTLSWQINPPATLPILH